MYQDEAQLRIPPPHYSTKGAGQLREILLINFYPGLFYENPVFLIKGLLFMMLITLLHIVVLWK
jgi:hypothetical protein